jgi:5'-methylthioadenosine phosphorylase
VKTAIIGGTGIGDNLRQNGGEKIQLQTRFGEFEALQRTDGILVVARHGIGHKLPPHRVPYKAMAEGLSSLGFQRCLSSAAVGSVQPELSPGTLAAVSDFIDFTGRNITMFEDDVTHTDFSPGVSSDLLAAFGEAGVRRQVVYACTNGPRYETPAEVRALRLLGADVVGMTMASEAVVMREAGIGYGCLAMVTNFAAGVSGEPLSHGEVVDAVEAVSATAVDILLSVAQSS